MTLQEWAAKQTGLTFKIPKGTRTGRIIHEYQTPGGEWVQEPSKHGLKWDEVPKRMRYEETTRDVYIELQINASGLEGMALKAAQNRSGKSVDGPLTVKRRR